MAADIGPALAALLATRTEWDEAPGLYFIYREAGNVRLSPASVVPEAFWPAVPTFALPVIASMFEDESGLLSAVLPGSLIGVAFRCEMWGVRLPDDEMQADLARAMHRARELETHPDRTEERVAWAVTVAGRSFVAKQERGSAEVLSEQVTGSITGLIPESLERILRALTAGAS